jgi:hypothetical protein
MTAGMGTPRRVNRNPLWINTDALNKPLCNRCWTRKSRDTHARHGNAIKDDCAAENWSDAHDSGPGVQEGAGRFRDRRAEREPATVLAASPCPTGEIRASASEYGHGCAQPRMLTPREKL